MDILKKFFPGLALKRELQRYQLDHIKRAYEAGRPVDFYPNKFGAGNSPNANIEVAGKRIRDRARYFDENLDLVTGLFDTLVLNIVGNNNPIRPLVRKPDGTLNSAVNDALINLWNQWGLSPTICKGYTINEALKLACRGWLRDGDFLTRFYRGVGRAATRAIPFSIELIEGDYLPYEKERRTEGQAQIIQGVEVDRFCRALAYHLYKDHPDNNLFSVQNYETKRVPASEILHLRFVRRVHQVRGVSILHSVMNRLEDLKSYEESEQIAARVAAAFTGYIKKPDGSMANLNADGSRQMEMSPGMIFDNLLPGEEIGTIGSNRPNPELTNYRQTLLRSVAAGTNTNASTISKNYMGTYSSQRQELLEAKPGYEGLRQAFVDQYLGPLWREFVSMLLVAGTISLEGVDPNTIDDIEIRGIDIGWIDPKKQADAIETAIQVGVTTRGQVIRDQGGDPAAVFAEYEEEKELFGSPLIYQNQYTNSSTTTDEGDDETEETEQDQE